MFYKENGVAHYKCDTCGAIDKIVYITKERWEAPVIFERAGNSAAGVPISDTDAEFVDVQDAWYECAACSERLPPIFDDSDLQQKYANAEEIENGQE